MLGVAASGAAFPAFLGLALSIGPDDSSWPSWVGWVLLALLVLLVTTAVVGTLRIGPWPVLPAVLIPFNAVAVPVVVYSDPLGIIGAIVLAFLSTVAALVLTLSTWLIHAGLQRRRGRSGAHTAALSGTY
ncbi:hypothetical protein NUM3379_36130 [Kineococcus sp. NUM-3379]